MSRRQSFLGALLAAGAVLAATTADAQQAAGPDAQERTGVVEGPRLQPSAEEAQKQPGDAPPDGEAKLTAVPGGKALGMSILGNQEAPTSLVIVPWKTSELGGSLGITPMLDDSRQPVDKDVFMRSLRYYEIRLEKKP